ncbi:glycosyltransferase [Roseomonas sp. 18066]|uniref:glycosyltransferase n=1 Tax=Roseomonas sp. 18066 TaxID=2681412 RepID=UPI001F3968C2|nr:glycosyltransferase [Roseomonas sp. 18066]
MSSPRIAVLLPCHNEAVAIGGVVAAFRAALPGAEIHVYDNNSTDGTVAAARAAGARLGEEVLQGKGNVLRRMFSDIEADFYLMADGDGTYDAADAPAMLALALEKRLDMVTAVRVGQAEAAYRPGHAWGNRLLTGLASAIFGRRQADMLSGYRLLSRRFVKSFPALSGGFEIETELTVHALELRMPIGELRSAYGARPAGSASKLRTFHDGARILATILALLQRERPLPFFGALALLFLLAAIGFFAPVFATYLSSGLVPRLPTFLASVCCLQLSFLAIAVGLILDTVTRGRQEARRIAYLGIAGPGCCAAATFSPPPGAKLGETGDVLPG